MTKSLAPAPTHSELKPVPGDGGLPVVGSGLEYLRDPLKMWKDRHSRFGPVSWFRAFGTQFVGLLGPDAGAVVLLNKDNAFASGDGWRFLIGPFFDRGLMLLDFEEHKSHKRLMQQAFTPDRLSRYAAAMDPAVEAAVARWEQADDFQVYPALKQMTLNIAVDVFMGGAPGVSQQRLDEINKAFIDCVQAATALIRYPVPGGRWHRGIAGRRKLEAFLREYLPARRAGDGEDIFSVLCRVEVDGERFTDDDVINHMIFLLMAAHDTSTITISTMMQYLGQHPEWQQRCRDESLAIVSDSIEFSELKQLESLDLVMKEALRLVSPVPTIVRKTVKDTEVLGHFIPADTMVAFAPYFSHHMEELWPNPEAFDPGRFSTERKEDKVHRMAWEPFGGGVHKCIGLHFAGAEIKIVLHHLLRNFHWHVDPGYKAPMDYKSLPFPKDGQSIRLTRHRYRG